MRKTFSLIAVSVWAGAAAAIPAKYEVEIIDHTSLYDTFGLGINNSGVVVGGTNIVVDDEDSETRTDDLLSTHAFWSTGIGLDDLGAIHLLPQNMGEEDLEERHDTQLNAINDGGIAVGFGDTDSPDDGINTDHAFYVINGGELVDINLALNAKKPGGEDPDDITYDCSDINDSHKRIPDDGNFRVSDVNNDNLLVGQADWRYGENNDSYNERAVVYDITNELLYPIPLISDPSDSVDDNLDPCHNDSRESSARHISNSGFVTGYSQIDGEIHAYRYRLPSYQAEGAVEQVTDLHPEELSTGQTGDDVFDIDGWSYGNAVNDQGVVVGMATTHDNTFQAYIYTDSGKMRTIHPSSDSLDEEERYSEALDINNNNQVVGVYKTQDDPEKLTAFIYEHETGSFADLNKRIDCSAGVYVGQAKKILDDGRILVDVQVLPDVVDENNRPVNRPAILTPSEGSASPCLDESEEDDSDSSGGGPIGSWLLLLGSMLCLRRFCVKS